jgi:Amidohydrolase family
MALISGVKPKKNKMMRLVKMQVLSQANNIQNSTMPSAPTPKFHHISSVSFSPQLRCFSLAIEPYFALKAPCCDKKLTRINTAQFRVWCTRLFFLLLLLFTTNKAWSQIAEPPPIGVEAAGPYKQLILRGAILVNGTGAPPYGPVDIVIKDNRIEKIQIVGSPGAPIDSTRRPKLDAGGQEINCEGKYVLPGFVDMHGHIGGEEQGVTAEYVYKLWLAHGITTIRDPSCGNGLNWVLKQKKASLKNEITAPRIFAYSVFGQDTDEALHTPEAARRWVRKNKERGADGIKFFGLAPAIMQAALEENKAIGLRSACHHAQLDVARWNVVNSARAGLTTMEHWYGLPEALFTDQRIQNYPLSYNYMNEAQRFGEAGRLWKQAAAPGSARWNLVMDSLLLLGFTIDPTFNIYEANRDLMRARTLEWHEDYTWPALWEFFQPNRKNHGSHWFDWGTEEEVAWRDNYVRWMTFVNEYKNRGGRVTAGSDGGYLFQVYGFGYIRELELLREAGFHPLEVIKSATLYGAEAIGQDSIIGSIEVGKRADMIIINGNPLENLQILYATGAIGLNQENEVIRTIGVQYTIKDGIVFDAAILRKQLRDLVAAEKLKTGFRLEQPASGE